MNAGRLRVRLLGLGLGLALGLVLAATAVAHPLGNATVNRQAHIQVDAGQIKIRYLLDFAEIPTLLAGQDADVDGDGAVSPAEWKAYATRWARFLRTQLALSLDGKTLDLALQRVEWSLADGAVGLQQLKLQASYTTRLPRTGTRVVLAYDDTSRPQEAGWREIWVNAGTGAYVVASDVPQTDRSRGLTQFPAGDRAFPQEVSARIVVTLAPLARRVQHVQPDAAPASTGNQAPPAVPVLAPSPPDAPTNAVLPAAAPAGPQAWAFFQLGIHHIATGWDHLVFLFGLLLFSHTLGQLLKIVTAFTLAHSMTLGLASAGMITPPGALVEPAIALSIAYVGLANLLWRHRVHGVAVAFGFGLVHGFGFAGALAESLSESLAGQAIGGGQWLWNLAAFNLGIETFQVALLCAAVPLLRRTERFDWSATARRGAALAVLGAGLSWFVLRLPLALAL